MLCFIRLYGDFPVLSPSLPGAEKEATGTAAVVTVVRGTGHLNKLNVQKYSDSLILRFILIFIEILEIAAKFPGPLRRSSSGRWASS